MGRIKYWIMGLSIRKKLIFYSYLIITPILLLISVLLFLHNYNRVLESERSNNLQSIQSLSDNVEAMQKSIMEIGTYITINTSINQILTTDEPQELSLDSQLWLHDAPMQMIQDMLAINGQIKTVAIYPENGVTPYLRCLDSSSYQSDFSQVRETDSYKQAVNSKGKMLWQRVGKKGSDIYASNWNEKIVLYREIYDLAKKRRLGYLAIGASAKKFDEVCSNSLMNKKEEVVVVSGTGAELVRCGALADKIVTEAVAEAQKEAGKEIVSISHSDLEYTIYQCHNEETGITIYKMVPKLKITDVMESTLIMPLALLLGFLAGLCPILILVSNIITKPLNLLCIAMRKFKKGDFDQKVEVITLDEVGEASACFNEMVSDMKTLINKNYVMVLKERESELDALQAQINPHFLYNTLDSLYWQVLEAGNEEAAEDIYALSELFRLVLSRGEGIVTVQNEQELLERYLQIQKMRFGKRLEYRIFINEAILEERIPKLILQPFVENAIVHGFEKGGESYLLSIVGEKNDGYMVFYIEDTGVGMTKQQIDAIWEEEDATKYAGQRIGHYAIKNVKERLSLKYRDDFSLRIESEEGRGTTVIIRIPCQNKG